MNPDLLSDGIRLIPELQKGPDSGLFTKDIDKQGNHLPSFHLRVIALATFLRKPPTFSSNTISSDRGTHRIWSPRYMSYQPSLLAAPRY